MNHPLKELLIVFKYQPLESGDFSFLLDELNKYLKGFSDSVWSLVNTQNSASVSIPNASIQQEVPDWSKMKVFVDKLYRYRSADNKLLIQICKNFMTINAAQMLENNYEKPRFEDLNLAFEQMLPFFTKVLIKRIHLQDIQYEVVNQFDRNHLKPLLSSRRNPKLLDYLDIFGLLRSLSANSNGAGLELHIPFRQEMVYHLQNDEHKKRMAANIYVNHSNANGWFANMIFTVWSEYIQEMNDSNLRLNAFTEMLPEYHALQERGLHQVLADKIIDSLVH